MLLIILSGNYYRISMRAIVGTTKLMLISRMSTPHRTISSVRFLYNISTVKIERFDCDRRRSRGQAKITRNYSYSPTLLPCFVKWNNDGRRSRISTCTLTAICRHAPITPLKSSAGHHLGRVKLNDHCDRDGICSLAGDDLMGAVLQSTKYSHQSQTVKIIICSAYRP